MMLFVFPCLLLYLVQVFAEVTVIKKMQFIYDQSPKLRIHGTGFDMDEHNIDLTIGVSATDQSHLVTDKDFLVTKDPDNDSLILKLLHNKKWADLSGKVPPVALVLSAVKLFSDSSRNLLAEPVIVAYILNTPGIISNSSVHYLSTASELRINGTGLIGSNRIDLYFSPPLTKSVAYEDVTKYPLATNQIILRLRHGYKWRDESGPLSIIGIDSGGGPVKLNGDDGILVAYIEADKVSNTLTVDSSVSQQRIYADEPFVVVTGSGFNPDGNLLRFANDLVGQGVNYTTVKTISTSITLKLVPGSFWQNNFDHLPRPLTLLAMNTSVNGYIDVNSIMPDKGKEIAMVFERPTIISMKTKLYKSLSHRLHISGTGFPDRATTFKPTLLFKPPLIEGVDYTLSVVSRTDLEVTLVDGKAWRTEPGLLYVIAINTRGDDQGWIKFEGEGVCVAEIIDNVESTRSNPVQIFSFDNKIYQSTFSPNIIIIGKGFKEGIAFTFDPPIQQGIEYDLDWQATNKIILRLRRGQKWKANAGPIVIKTVQVDGKKYPVGGNQGFQIANVLADPVITSTKAAIYHESQSKLVTIIGSGFTNPKDLKISLRPTNPNSYQILSVLDSNITLRLKSDKTWLPSFMSLKGDEDNKKIALQVTGIDTGAGFIDFNEPVTVGQIIKDRKDVICDDSCEFAFNGVCDRIADVEPVKQLDDDNGGYYGSNKKDPSCAQGTDCTDCGGIDAIAIDNSSLPVVVQPVSCTNTCQYPRDGVCDDPRGTSYCAMGTDCQDCGPVEASNFTRPDDDLPPAMDHDDYWTFNDGLFINQTNSFEEQRNKETVQPHRQEKIRVSSLLLRGMAYSCFIIISIVSLYLLNKWYKQHREKMITSRRESIVGTDSSHGIELKSNHHIEDDIQL